MSARRCAVIAAVGFVTASASAGAQMWSSPNTYCPIASFCLEEYFFFSLTSDRYERMFAISPRFVGGAYLRSSENIQADNWNDAVFKFEDVLRNREDDPAPPALDDPKLRMPEVPVDVPDNPRNEIPDDPRRHEDPNVPVPPTPDPRLEEPILTPEPSTLLLLGATLPLAIGFIRGRRKR